MSQFSIILVQFYTPVYNAGHWESLDSLFWVFVDNICWKVSFHLPWIHNPLLCQEFNMKRLHPCLYSIVCQHLMYDHASKCLHKSVTEFWFPTDEYALFHGNICVCVGLLCLVICITLPIYLWIYIYFAL